MTPRGPMLAFGTAILIALPTIASAQLSTAGAFFLHQGVADVNGNPDAGDAFGDSVAAGDFDGDGRGDLAVGVPGESVGSSTSAGAVHVFLGGGTPFDLATDVVFHQDTSGVPGVAEPGDRFGTTLAVGDFDGNGIDDLAVGAPNEDIGSTAGAGAVWVLFGSASGLNGGRAARLFDQSSFAPDENPEANDHLGAALAAGDLTGDGLDDLAIGVPGEDLLPFTTDAGTLHLLFSSTGADILANTWTITQGEIDPTTGSFDPTPAEEPEVGDQYGFALAMVDFDGDGRDDIATGAPGDAIDGVSHAGVVEVIFGSALQIIDHDRSAVLHQNVAAIEGSCETDDRFGSTLATGDLDGDGIGDLVVGIPSEGIGNNANAGAVAILFGPLNVISGISDQFFSQDDPTGIGGVAEASDHFGAALAVGDFDSDTFDDLAIGVQDEDVGSISNAGAVNVLYGGPSGLGSSGNQVFDQGTSGVADASEAADIYGGALAAADFDGDGDDDLAIGVAGEEVAGSPSAHGALVLLRGN